MDIKDLDPLAFNDAILAIALEYLDQFQSGDPMPDGVGVDFGSRRLIREGQKRQVHFLNIDDGSGAQMSIEVYIRPVAKRLEDKP